jgi:hypothetical protein
MLKIIFEIKKMVLTCKKLYHNESIFKHSFTKLQPTMGQFSMKLEERRVQVQ